jgi:hypothetical protein
MLDSLCSLDLIVVQVEQNTEALLQTSLLLRFDRLQDPHRPLFILLLFNPTLLFIPPYNVSSKKQNLGFFPEPAPIFPFVKQTSGRLSSYFYRNQITTKRSEGLVGSVPIRTESVPVC